MYWYVEDVSWVLKSVRSNSVGTHTTIARHTHKHNIDKYKINIQIQGLVLLVHTQLHFKKRAQNSLEAWVQEEFYIGTIDKYIISINK